MAVSVHGALADSARILENGTLAQSELQKVANLIFAACPQAVLRINSQGTLVDIARLDDTAVFELHAYLTAIETEVAPV
jgi:hypothetical protein